MRVFLRKLKMKLKYYDFALVILFPDYQPDASVTRQHQLPPTRDLFVCS